jgi:hypothetical protein
VLVFEVALNQLWGSSWALFSGISYLVQENIHAVIDSGEMMGNRDLFAVWRTIFSAQPESVGSS